MTITTFSSRQFNQDAGKAKKAAEVGPVFITDRGRPAHVLLTFETYQKTGGQVKLAELLASPGAEDVEFELTRSQEVARAPDFD
jgi:PHD/YefM family antitoxin component YafN of YafNO toxin-antitoxin module